MNSHDHCILFCISEGVSLFDWVTSKAFVGKEGYISNGLG